ncbi:hypothetical protein B0H14DRAFT_3458999 [Mycena olivaceomarginata]|nr:hypothetical protein B0H14DRAFT_3458999 [Mycena olivaceomarginata]
MRGVPLDAAGTPPSLWSRLLAPSAPRRASACPSPTLKNIPPIFFFATYSALFPDAGALPASSEPSPRTPFAYGAACSPRALPDAHRRAQIPPPKTHRQKKNCNLIGAVPGCGGTTRAFGALSSNPRSPAEPPARPEHSQTRIGVPKSHPQKHTTNFFFATSSALFPDAGGITRVFEAFRSTPRASSRASASGGFPNSRCQQYPRKVRSREFTRTYILLLRRPRARGGRRRSRHISSSIHHAGFPCPSSFSLTWSWILSHCPEFLSHLVRNFLCLPSHPAPPPFSLPHFWTSVQLPGHYLSLSHSHLRFCSPAASHNNPQRPQAAMSQYAQSGERGRRLTRFSHQSNKAKFLTYRATRPYAKEGPGWCYNVACAADVDIA